MNRRTALIGMGSMAAGARVALGMSPSVTDEAAPRASRAFGDVGGSGEFPRKADFAIPEGLTFLNSASVHPMPVAVADVVRRYSEARARPGVDYAPWPVPDVGDRVKAQYAALINAKPTEISFISNTSSGENLVVAGLDIGHGDGNVVTDALHFEGALIHLQSLQRERGLDLRIVTPREYRIELADLERVIDRKTKLVEISLVSMYNGFQHDLKAVCDLAHAHGAYVYADIIQAVGATPIDVKASGVDFCSCAGFKWLMGDFGLGFLYVREELLDTVMRRTHYGYDQATRIDTHFMPHDTPAASPLTWELGRDATSHFQVGSLANGARAALYESLPYVKSLGVERIEAHRQPLLAKLREEMPGLGFELATPPDSKSALITFGMKDGRRVAERLHAANVSVRLSDHWLRISPSVFNDDKDVDRLLEALS